MAHPYNLFLWSVQGIWCSQFITTCSKPSSFVLEDKTLWFSSPSLDTSPPPSPFLKIFLVLLHLSSRMLQDTFFGYSDICLSVLTLLRITFSLLVLDISPWAEISQMLICSLDLSLNSRFVYLVACFNRHIIKTSPTQDCRLSPDPPLGTPTNLFYPSFS